MIELVIWAGISISLGYVEGCIFHINNNLAKQFKAKYKINIHVLFTIIRGLLIAPLVVYSVEPFMFLFISMLIFPFLHDGFYYITRKRMSNGLTYPKGFVDHSTTTSAIFSFSFFWRLLFFVFGISMIFVLI